MKRILFVISEDWAVLSHRLHLIEFAISRGYQVGLVTKFTKHHSLFRDMGIEVFNWNLLRGSRNPWRELQTLYRLRQAINRFNPDLIHAVAIKPAIYASLANLMSRRSKCVLALGGLGYIFTSNSLKAKLLGVPVSIALKVAFAFADRLILQNPDDKAVIIRKTLISDTKIETVPGAGVEIEKFVPTSVKKTRKVVLLPARLLKDKGVFEFVEVARRFHSERSDVEFVLAGDLDPQNPASIPQCKLLQWRHDGIITHLERLDHDAMPQLYRDSRIVCLPSYREGFPKVLLEASSCGRPIVAFDVPGSREVVKHGVNGLLVPVNDVDALEGAIRDLIDDKEMCKQMGDHGRQSVVQSFSDQIVNAETERIWIRVQDQI